jgi:outer membrane lipoprotein
MIQMNHMHLFLQGIFQGRASALGRDLTRHWVIHNSSSGAPMTASMRFPLVLTLLCLLGAAGCVSYPISKEFREQAQATKDLSFLTIWQSPETYKGRMVIWGGKILKTINETNGGSIYVLQAPLDDQERPKSTKLSQGRFIITSSGFLDPEVYRAGAKITIAGELSGTETQNVGKIGYAYPVVMLRDVYFWRPEAAVLASPYPWGWGWNGTYWQYGDGDYGNPGYYYPAFDLDWGRRFDHSPQEPGEGEHERR